MDLDVSSIANNYVSYTNDLERVTKSENAYTEKMKEFRLSLQKALDDKTLKLDQGNNYVKVAWGFYVKITVGRDKITAVRPLIIHELDHLFVELKTGDEISDVPVQPE